LARSLAGAALLLALTQETQAATIQVTTNKPDIKADGKCSIIEAVTNANDHAQTFSDCTAGTGDDTIVLPSSSTITFTQSTYDNGKLPTIKSTMTIEGNSARLVRKRSKLDFFAVFVSPSGNLTLLNVTMSGWAGSAIRNAGTLRLADSILTGNKSTFGGGIYNSANATLLIENTTISGNTAFEGGAIYNKSIIHIDNGAIYGNASMSSGGAIQNFGGSIFITNSTISGNEAIAIGKNYTHSAFGGGIYSSGGYIGVFDSTIFGNSATAAKGGRGHGGGIESFFTDTVIRNSTITDNQALSATGQYAFGGGIEQQGASLTIENSTISDNSAQGPKKGSGGGGLFTSGVTTIVNSTVSGNISGGKASGEDWGGGIINYGSLTLSNSTISGNRANKGGGIANIGSGGIIGTRSFTQLALTRNIVSGNEGTNGPEIYTYASKYFPLITGDSFNLFGANNEAGVVGFTRDSSDIVPAAGMTIDKILAPLADNGGPTLTHALVAGSPAIDAAPTDSHCPATDQRGNPRPQGGGCDIGAFEK
jgi:hypothetical protein